MKEKKMLKLMKTLQKTEYYKSILKDFDISINNIHNVFEKLPVIYREDIDNDSYLFISSSAKEDITKDNWLMCKTNIEKLSSNHDTCILGKRYTWFVEFTTGSSGKPFAILKSSKTRLLEGRSLLATRMKLLNCNNISDGFMFLHSNNDALKTMDLWKFDRNDMDYIIDQWISKIPTWIFGTPLILFKYANRINERGITSLHGKIDFIEYTSQYLDPYFKKVIDKAFASPIYSNYGSREFWNIAYECKYGHFHINDRNLIVEIIDKEGNIIKDDNCIGKVIITNLCNLDMPLVRYYIGDTASLHSLNCPCGNRSKIIKLQPDKSGIITGTNINGANLFRRVMRGLYFHDYFHDVESIRIIQSEIRKFDIYVQYTGDNKEFFEERFLFRLGTIFNQIDNYNFSFKYVRIIEDKYGKRLKEKIFISLEDSLCL